MAGFRKSVAGVPASVWAALAAVSVVNVVAHRARQLSIESELTHEPLEEKPVTLAIREVAAGSLKATLDDKYRH